MELTMDAGELVWFFIIFIIFIIAMRKATDV